MHNDYESRSYSEVEGRRKKIAFYEKGPGPAGYMLPGLVGRRNHAITHLNNPEYSLRQKFPFKPLGIGPGSGAYMLPSQVKSRPWNKPPAYSLRIRTKTDFRHEGPGPANYKTVSPDIYKWSFPSYSIRSSPLVHIESDLYETPGPNSYLLPPAIGPKIPDKIAAPEVTLKGRRTKGKECVSKPFYNVNFDAVLPRAPAVKILGRWPETKLKSYNCGPASYSPNYCKCARTPAPSFSYRFNDFTGILRTECDQSSY